MRTDRASSLQRLDDLRTEVSGATDNEDLTRHVF